jgi:hypothetical protein
MNYYNILMTVQLMRERMKMITVVKFLKKEY